MNKSTTGIFWNKQKRTSKYYKNREKIEFDHANLSISEWQRLYRQIKNDIFN